MSLPNEVNSLLLNGGDYQISRSVRLRSSATAYFSKAFSVPTSYTTSTWSFWLKGNTANMSRFAGGGNYSTTGGSFVTQVFFDSSGAFRYVVTNSNTPSSYLMAMVSTPLFRDPSAWYHFVVVVDTTNATSTDRLRLYVNGVRITAFSTYTTPSLNYAGDTLFKNTTSHIGTQLINSGVTFGSTDGYLAEMNFIDGQALTSSSFGETNTLTGVWKPKKYTGTYGTNGFYLNFLDNSAASTTTIGKDYSGNGNNWTPTNISVTAGVTYDSMLDTPTPYADGGNGRGNYPTFNPLKKFDQNFAITEGNLTASDSSATSVSRCVATMRTPTTGKWYWEVNIVSGSGLNCFVQAVTEAIADSTTVGSNNGYRSNGTISNLAGTTQTSGATYTAGDVIGVAVDIDNGTCQFYKNGVAQGATPSYTFTAGTILVPAVGGDNSAGTKTFGINFGQRPFAYTVPSGFKTLNTANLPVPTIKNGVNFMNAIAYTGDGATPTRTISGLTFAPDLVWIKGRSIATSNMINDNVRGVNLATFTNLTNAETTLNPGGYLSAFTSSGFSVAIGATDFNVANANGSTYVAWNWKAGDSTVTNTSGTISSQVRANPTAGFSIVTYTGTGANATVGHGLGVAPGLVIVKRRNAVASWLVWHNTFAGTEYIVLESTAAKTSLAAMWNSTIPTSSVFSVGTNANTNGSASTYVAYCWSEVTGYSKIGTYTGNGSADGPFVYCGFRPSWIMFKSSSAVTDWTIIDTTRNTYNSMPKILYPNTSGAEATGLSTEYIDVTANGFKVRTNGGGYNTSSGTYIFMAFAETPFKYSLAR